MRLGRAADRSHVRLIRRAQSVESHDLCRLRLIIASGATNCRFRSRARASELALGVGSGVGSGGRAKPEIVSYLDAAVRAFERRPTFCRPPKVAALDCPPKSLTCARLALKREQNGAKNGGRNSSVNGRLVQDAPESSAGLKRTRSCELWASPVRTLDSTRRRQVSEQTLGQSDSRTFG